jgi:hypothetical protein
MNQHSDDSDEIGVFDAARYFSDYEILGTFSCKYSTVDTQPTLIEDLDQPKCETNLFRQKYNQKRISKATKATSAGARLSVLFNSFFHQSNSKKNKHKQLVNPAVPVTFKSYPLSPKTNSSLMHYSQCNDGFAGDLWRDRRLDGIMVVGKRWVLNNSANDEGLFCKVLLGDKGLSEKKKKTEEDSDDCSSDASSDLFELENCS